MKQETHNSKRAAPAITIQRAKRRQNPSRESWAKIVGDRLHYQSTRRSLEALGVTDPSLPFLESNDFKKIYDGWDSFKRQRFLKLVSGSFMAVSKKYLNLD